MATIRAPRVPDVRATGSWRRPGAAHFGLISALALIAVAIGLPAFTGWDVHIGFAPLFASWGPRVGPGTLVSVPLAIAGVAYGGRLSQTLAWPRLLGATWLACLGWLASLLLVDVKPGFASYSDTDDLLRAARAVTDISITLHEFASRIPLSPHDWDTHVAGHPPGALLFFVLLVRVGLGGNVAAGIVITLLASTVPLATMITLRNLGAERAARLAAPFLVFAPAAIWEAVSADAVFTCVAAWGLAALALGAVRRSILWSAIAGILLGGCVEMSYGLPLLGFLAIGVLIAARSYFPLAWSAAAALVVIAAFSWGGFSLWSTYPVLHERYQAGIAGLRPTSYWIWGDLAALCLAAGPILGACVACWIQTARAATRTGTGLPADDRVVMILGGAAIASVIAADISLFSKAEVERIWLPFVPWLLILSALLPPRWRRPALAVQVVAALLIQHLLVTGW